MLSKFPWEKDIPWSSNYLDNYMPRLDDKRFQQKLRMSPTTFKHVLGMIWRYDILEQFFGELGFSKTSTHGDVI
jgi:hypothetical protein